MRKIEFGSAKKVLLRAKKRCKKVNDTTGELIEKVLRGSHKTYRYILITALLAKSTNEEIDASAFKPAMIQRVHTMPEVYATK